MSKVYVSRSARKVLDFQGFDPYPPAQQYLLELNCLQFFPNHIISVVEQILKKADGSALERFMDQGWVYMSQPVRSILKNRKKAWRPAAPGDMIYDLDPWHLEVYAHLVGTLEHDFNEQEAKALLLEIPLMTMDRPNLLMDARRAAEQQRNRNILYLKGIIEREAGTRDARAEREHSKVVLSTPEEVEIEKPDPETVDHLTTMWAARKKRIEVLRELHNL